MRDVRLQSRVRTRGSRVVALSFCACLATGAPAMGQGTPISDGFVTTRSGVRIHYLQAGSNMGASALILIPGWRLPAWLWREQLQRFARLTRVLASDPRSQGESSITADGNTPETRASDLHDALASLGVARLVRVGCSQGAQDVAATVKQNGTDAIAGIVFVDSPVSAGAAEVVIRPQFAKVIIATSVCCMVQRAAAARAIDHVGDVIRELRRLPRVRGWRQRASERRRERPASSGRLSSYSVSNVRGWRSRR